jgi:hypothetical protein
LQFGIDVVGEPKMKIEDPLSKQTLMKSNAQLRRDDQDDDLPPPPIHVEMPGIASPSQIARPPQQQDAGYAEILATLASLQGGGHEFYAASCFLYAAGYFFYAVGGSLC